MNSNVLAGAHAGIWQVNQFWMYTLTTKRQRRFSPVSWYLLSGNWPRNKYAVKLKLPLPIKRASDSPKRTELMLPSAQKCQGKK